MKQSIGIITYHSSINYGAFLQSFSLAKALNNDLDANVEIINYTPGYKKVFYILKVLASLRKWDFLKLLKQYIAFRKAQKLLPLSKRIRTSNYSKQCYFLNHNYSAIVIGSDEVLSAGKKKMRTFPDIYWPNNIVTVPKLIYAGSANRSNYLNLSKQDLKIMRKIMNGYSYIGIRDQYTFNQIMLLDSSLEPQINCDPTFLISFNATYIDIKKSLASKIEKLTKRPIIAIMTKNDSTGYLIKNHFGDKYFLLAVYYPNAAADYFYADMSPLEWAVGFSIYAGCITQLFHATVFSIKNNLPFISIDNNPLYDGRTSKISDLLGRANIMENYFNLRSDNYSDDKLLHQFKKNLINPQIEKMSKAVENQVSLYKPFIKQLRNELVKAK